MTAPTASCELRVGGMDCPSCAAGIESALRQLRGVRGVSVDVVRGLVRVDLADEGAGLARRDVAAVVRRLGYSVATDEGEGPQDRDGRGRLVATVVSGAALGTGLLLGWLGLDGAARTALLALAGVAAGWYVAPRALAAARQGVLDMHVLMTLAAIGAAGIGEWVEGASVLFLFSVAQLLERASVGRARRAIAALVDLAPREATVLRGGEDLVVPVADVAVGETVRVRPGERIPLDGVVVEGRSAVDEATITGESMPVEKETGSEVFAGSINSHGGLLVRTTAHVEDTTLARILHAVEEAQASRAPSQAFVERFARVYTPAVVVLAVVLAVAPPLLGLGTWGTWTYRALALLVIACPCALVLSTPVTIVSGLAAAARRGVLIKGGAQLEEAGRITAVVFDKTGTLTEGRAVVTDVIGLDGLDERGVLRLAAAVESHSEHPIGRAIVRAARERGIPPVEVGAFASLQGMGARADVEGQALFLGNERVCERLGTCSDLAHETMARLAEEGKTAVLLTSEREPLGVLAIADRVRPDARASVDALRASGVRRVMMLTGDNPAAARRVADALGLDEFRASLFPEEKNEIVRALKREGERVAVVGDGVNDAPALASANVGIAMGAAGTHVALETADVALMADDLTQLAGTVRRSRQALRLIRQNVWFSLLVKAAVLVLAVAGQATLWMAIAADTGASLAVVGNGLRALRD